MAARGTATRRPTAGARASSHPPGRAHALPLTQRRDPLTTQHPLTDRQETSDAKHADVLEVAGPPPPAGPRSWRQGGCRAVLRGDPRRSDRGTTPPQRPPALTHRLLRPFSVIVNRPLGGILPDRAPQRGDGLTPRSGSAPVATIRARATGDIPPQEPQVTRGIRPVVAPCVARPGARPGCGGHPE